MISTAQALLTDLDSAQREAATSVDGPVRIIAGAGAGKTRTITRRIAYAVESGQWNPSKVLAVTFSVKAAREMKSRLDQLGVEGVTASTFHSAALRQLIGDDHWPGVWDDLVDGPFPHISEDQERNVASAITRITNISNLDRLMVRDVQAEINWCKVQLIAPDDYVRVCSATHRTPPCGLEPKQFTEVYHTYEDVKTSRAEIDFNDLLLLACHVLESFPDAAQSIRRHIGFLTVDEYQDVSPLQHRLMTLWLGEDNRNICVVGDPAQTIYRYAGATSYYLTNFAAEFAPLKADIRLDADYRSNPPVIRLANRILNDSPVRDQYLKLHAVRTGQPRVVRTRYDSDEAEAQAVALQIQAYVQAGGKAADCAILTRLNSQQRIFAKALEELGIRYQLRRNNGWQESAVIEPLVAPSNESAQQAQQPQESQQPQDNGSPTSSLPSAEPPQLDGEPSSTASASEPQQLSAAEQVQQMRDVTCVTISTIHASKGLEFKQVFLVGLSEGLLPYGSPSEGTEDLEEERRLMYVGVTRAEDKLYLSFAQRKQAGNGTLRHPSRFLR